MNKLLIPGVLLLFFLFVAAFTFRQGDQDTILPDRERPTDRDQPPPDRDTQLPPACTPTGTAGVEFAEDRGKYLIFNADALIDKSWADSQVAQQNFQALARALYAVHDDDIDFLFILQGDGSCCRARPLAESERGIGQEAEIAFFRENFPAAKTYFPPEYPFDLTPNSRAEGLIFMGNWREYFYLPDPLGFGPGYDRIRAVTSHELGHHWLAKVRYRDAQGTIQDDILGGEHDHWSLYFDSGTSPMQGLDWTDNGDGTFSAQAKESSHPKGFSDLDLYLLGLLDPQEVQPSLLIRNPHTCILDGQRKECPLPTSGSRARGVGGTTITVSGTATTITIQDIIAAEGPRVPDVAASRKTHNVAFIYFKRSGEQLTEEDKKQIETIADWSVQAWSEMTRGKGTLVNRSPSMCPAA